MNAYKFAQLPSNSSVASLVTLVVSGWFLVAAAAIISEPTSVYTQRVLPAPGYAQAARATPDARFTITVSAKRLTPHAVTL